MTMKHLPLAERDPFGVQIDGASTLPKVTVWCGETVPPASVFTFAEARKVKPMTYQDMAASGFDLNEMTNFILPDGKVHPCLDCLAARTQAAANDPKLSGLAAAALQGAVIGLIVFLVDAVIAWALGLGRPRIWTYFWNWLTT